MRAHAARRHRAGACPRPDERVGLDVRLRAGRVGKRDALHDEAPRTRRVRRGDQIARTLDAEPAVARVTPRRAAPSSGRRGRSVN